MVWRLAAVGLLALMALPAVAQEKLVESIEVRVVNVDVVVRDRAGNPVTGLTKDDFELYDDGKRQEISNLYEIRPPASASQATGSPATAAPPSAPADVIAPQAEVRPRKLVVFIDNYSLPPLRRNAILQSLQRYVDTQMRPEDQMMLVLWAGQTKILSQFSGDKALLHKAIASVSDSSNSGFTHEMEVDRVKRRAGELLQLAKEASGETRQGITFAEAYSQTLSTIDTYSERVTHMSMQLLDTLARTTAALAGVDGKKVILLAGSHLPEKPGAELYTYAYNLFSPFDGQAGFHLTFNMQSVTGSSGAVHFSIEATAKQAAANGVALYMLDAADSRDSISAEKGGDSTVMADETEKFQTYTNTAMAYRTLARVTGGIAVTNTENFDYAFDTITRDLNSYYSLGYKPAEDATGPRKLVVKMKNPQYRARTRETYTPKSTEEQMKDRVIANIYDPVQGDWKVELKSGTPQREGGQFKVPVQVSLAPTITLLPKDDKLVGGFTLFIAVGNGSGGRSTVTRSPQSVSIPPAAEKQLRSRPMTFTAMIMVTPGENTLSIGVLDQISNSMGFGRATVKAE